ncbi:unnamed protein product [Rotaria magnacalcarata]|uniref:VCBS repeat-containing protein n=1 Tax=Rotaria magnacalcarata TaxID=392030 RepID=A0A816LJ58_9BILA|nr:unnamed protein product [Rotaria magnacalcarata]
MIENSIRSNPIPFEQARDAHHSHVANKQCESTAQNQTSSTTVAVLANQKIKKSTNNATPLNKTFWSKHGLAVATGVFGTLTTMAITIVGSFTNDDNPDIAVPNYGSNEIVVILNNGNGAFANRVNYSTCFASPYSIVAGDFNQDNRPDLIAINNGTNNTGLFLGSGNSTFGKSTMYSTGALSSISFAICDINKDHRLDIIMVSNGTGAVDILLGSFEGFETQIKFSAGSYPICVAVADFNNGTRLDIVVVNLGTNDVSVLLASINYIGFLKQSTLTTGNGSRPQSLVIDDFNHDSQMDLAVVNSGSYNIAIFLGYDNYSFVNPTILATGSEPMPIASGDFNDDTRFDVVVANYASRSVNIFLGYDNDSFTNQTIYSTGSDSYPYFVAVGDFNNDISLDVIIVIQYTNNIGIFLGYGNGTFSSITLIPMGYGSNPFFVLVGDFNNDTKLDFAVANSGTDSLSILLQTC